MSRILPFTKQNDESKNPLKSIKEIQKQFQVDLNKGLSWKQANIKLSENQKQQTFRFYFFSQISRITKVVAKNLVDKFSLLLWFDFIIFILSYQPLEEIESQTSSMISLILILMCFIVKSTILGIQEYKTVKLERMLKSPNKTPVLVLRDSRWTSIPASELVIGDVIEINANQHVPATIRLFYINNLTFDKSILTGNLVPVPGFFLLKLSFFDI